METEERVERLGKLQDWTERVSSADMVTLYKALSYLPAYANELTIGDVRRVLRSYLQL